MSNDFRRDVRWLVDSARAFLRHFNPYNLAEDKSQQWQALSHQCDVVERALAQPETVEPVACWIIRHANGQTDATTDRDRANYWRRVYPKAVVTPVPTTAPNSERVREALKALYTWYDRDGSVGGASEVFENHREVLLLEQIDEISTTRESDDLQKDSTLSNSELFNILLSRFNLDGIDPRTVSLATLQERAIGWMPSPEQREAKPLHDWVKSTLGHGETMCSRCRITNREAAVLGKLNECEPQPLKRA